MGGSRARHLLHLRALQMRTGGITEFVPLPFVHMQVGTTHPHIPPEFGSISIRIRVVFESNSGRVGVEFGSNLVGYRKFDKVTMCGVVGAGALVSRGEG